MCGYQWSEESDIDLHLVINDEELAQEKNMTAVELSLLLNSSIKNINKKYYFFGWMRLFF